MAERPETQEDAPMEGWEESEPQAEPQETVIAPDKVTSKKRKDVQDTEMKEADPNQLLKPEFPPLNPSQANAGKSELRRIGVPPHRLTPLRENWMKIYTPIVQNLKLQIRFNTRSKQVEIRTSNQTEDIANIQKAEDFVRAFLFGFDINDAIALLRMDDLYIDSFDIEDVKMLHGDHMSRAIGRIAGKDGKTKFAIENATRTRIVLADKMGLLLVCVQYQRIHILGSFASIKVARDAVCSLILGSPPGKVYAKLRTVAARLNEK